MIAVDYYKKKFNQLKLQCQNTRIYLNMVIHDLRNPANQIHFTVSHVVQELKNLGKEKEIKCDKEIGSIRQDYDIVIKMY